MTFVGLLRAVNVGGRSLPMADLRALCSTLRWANVRTYIQSGNVVFDAEGDEAGLGKTLETALAAKYPFPVPVMVRSAARWRELAADRPFGGWSDPRRLAVCVLDSVPTAERWQTLAPWKDGEDELELIGDRLWLKIPYGQAETKYTNTWLEKQLKVRSTGRNRNTVDALLAML